MSLNDLPPELTDLVVSYLCLLESPDYEWSSDSPRAKPQIAKYACASINLQNAVEKHMFRHLILDDVDLYTFAPLIAVSPRRTAILRSVTFIPTLPDPNDHTCQSKSSCQQANDKAFSVAIQNLYTALHFCDGIEGKHPLRLILGPTRAPIDDDDAGPQLDFERHSRWQFGGRICLNPADRVTQFTCFADSGWHAYVTPASIPNLLKGLPEVEDVFLNMKDNKMNTPGLWTELRMDFARRLRRVNLPALTHLHLSYRYEAPLDERFVYSPARKTGGRPAGTQDALSTSIHRLIAACPKLKTVYVNGPICLDESLFWPHKAQPNEARWPSLESLIIEMSAVRPDGGWYLDRHPDMPLDEPENLFGDSDDESEAGLADPFEDPEYFDALTTGNAFKLSCRSQPNESLECVLEAAARAAKTMPSLCSLAFTIHVNSCPRTDYEPGAFGFVYQKKGHTFKEEPLPCSEILWVGPREWKMSKSLEEGWKEVLGAEAEIQYRGW
jgi:hypothetical protein